MTTSNAPEMQIYTAILHKAYLKINNIQTYDMRSFEFWNKNDQYTKIPMLLTALSIFPLSQEEKQAYEILKNSEVKAVQNGVDFVKELIKK